MKVLFIVTAYPRHDGDVITPWMVETIKRLFASGTAVEVLAPSYRGSRTARVGGVKVHRFRYAPSRLETLTHDMPAMERIRRNPAFAVLLPAYIAAGIKAAARVAADGNFDVVHAFWPIPHGLFGIAARQSSRAALVSTFFSAELMWKAATRRAMARVVSRVVKASDVVTVISSYTGARLREYVPDAATVTIPFGAAAADERQAGLGGTRQPRSPNDRFELLFVGRLVERKGVDVLIRAAAILRDDPRLTVRIVGTGPEMSSLRDAASSLRLGDRLVFEGMVSAEAIVGHFARCDALVLPAVITSSGDTEGLGVVLIEAMGYGKPVIASAAGGIVDIVTDGDTGLLVPPGDADALAGAIRHAMDDPDEMRRLAKRGTAFAAEAFGWNTIVTRLSAVYESAVAARSRS
ncbi:MAG: glycosyltransferase family 4 protein [Gemmatimonadaceae bacterium]